MDAIQMM